MKMFVAMVSGLLLSSAAFAQPATGASTGGNGNETAAETSQPAGNSGATGTTTGNGSEAGPTNENGERLICRRINNTETRLRQTRVCLTAAQWRREARGD